MAELLNPGSNIPMPFGKHKGDCIDHIPDDYLKWLLETDWFDKQYPKLTEIIDKELKWRKMHRAEIKGEDK